MHFASSGPYYLHEFQEIAQDSHSGHSRARACALHDQRPSTVPLGVEHDDVVGASERGREGVGDGVPTCSRETWFRIYHMSTTYFSRSALMIPACTSTTPANRRTLPSAAASARILSKCASNSGSRLINSSPESMPSSSAGTSDFVLTDWYPLGSAERREGMKRETIVSLRATSAPLRSSAGCGSCSATP